jgi:hypothetical protein
MPIQQIQIFARRSIIAGTHLNGFVSFSFWLQPVFFKAIQLENFCFGNFKVGIISITKSLEFDFKLGFVTVTG